jgi:Condensation domain
MHRDRDVSSNSVTLSQERHLRPIHPIIEQANSTFPNLEVELGDEMNVATHGTSTLTARLGSLEELVWLYDQTSPFHFVMGATFVGAGTAAPWREVLDALQRRHPLLRVRIERAASAYPKFVTDEAARIPLRMGNADIGWAGEMSRELQISFDYRNAPLIRAVVCGATTGSTLLLTVHHAIADAVSLTWVFRDVLLLFSGQKLELLGPAVSQDEMLGNALRVVSERPARTLPPATASESSFRERLQVQHRALSRDLTTAIAEKARSESTTVFGALSAAAILAGRSLSNRWRTEAVRFLCPVSSRRHAEFQEAVRAYFNIIPLHLAPKIDSDLWGLARYCKAAVLPAQSREGAQGIAKQLVGFLEAGPSPADVCHFMHAHFASNGSLSSVGAIPYPTRARDIELTAIWGPALSTGVDGEQYLGAVTVNGQLHLTNTSSLPISDLLSKTESILARACV